jgi:GTP cyclohydrolase IA
MKPNETLLNTRLNNHSIALAEDEIGEQHLATSIETPLRTDAFDLSNEEKIENISLHFREIMITLGLDLNDDSLKGTPKRVAKMYVNELFSGLNPDNIPAITLFDNKFRYQEMLVERDILFHSNCEHHFVPIIGKAHVAYISSGKVIGLSKLNRLVQYYARRPQVQERLTMQIAKSLNKVLDTEDIAVLMEASHHCVSMRGVEDTLSSTVTSYYGGRFLEENKKQEFMRSIRL